MASSESRVLRVVRRAVAVGAIVLGALMGATLASTALADDTMRCGSRLVSTGDGKDKVRALCGEPTSVSLVGVQSAPQYYYRGPYDYSYFGPTWFEVPVEVWTYNFGTTKLLRKLRFVGDELDEIWTAGYGY
jgi:hypothetical protein